MIHSLQFSMPTNVIETGSLVYLRYPQAKDHDAFIRLRRSNRDFLQVWEPRSPHGFDSFGEDQFRWIRKICRTPEQERLFIFSRAENHLVGQISLGAIVRGPFLNAFVGYWLGKEHIGNGYMTEALGLMMHHAFVTLGLHRLEANIQPHNEPSKAAARRAGFRLEGYSPKYLKIDNVWADHERWAITVEDWQLLVQERSHSQQSTHYSAKTKPGSTPSAHIKGHLST